MENDDTQPVALVLEPATQFVSVTDPSPTVPVLWDRAVQEAIIETAPGPTIGSRASALVHTAAFDAWAAYDPLAEPVAPGSPQQRPAPENTEAAKAEAMSHAAHAVATELFPAQAAIFDALMAELGYAADPGEPGEGTPAAVGLAAAEALMAVRRTDGSNQLGGYADTTGYAPVNPGPLDVVDIARWTPENLPIDPEDASPEQSFLTPQWGEVETFALPDGAALRPPPPEPFFAEGVEGTLDIAAGTITLADGTVLAVTPDLVGPVINPGFLAQAERVIAASAGLTDEEKMIAEFWEDGGGTAFPPSTWLTFGQFLSARQDHDLDTDAGMFLALSNAVLDAGIATWEAKVFYDYARPVRVIRDLGELGLIGTPGTDEITGEEGFVIEAWAGPGLGTATILAESFLTYQTPGADPSPPFAEYTSGHSAFSAAGAAVLAAYSAGEGDAFGASVTFPPGTSRFEASIAPVETVTLEWETFSQAADEAGLSRIFGGIHFDDGDLNGRALGADIGRAAYTLAQRHLTGTAGDDPDPASTRAPAPDEVVEVARLYQVVLGRFADRAGLDFWEDVAGAQGPLAVARGFLDSPEYARSFGATEVFDPAGLADRFVLNAGLDPDATDLDETLEGRLRDGAAAAEVALDAVRADEVGTALAYLDALAEVGDDSFWFA